MRRLVLLFLSALVILSAAPPAAAQKFLPKTIQFKGDPEYSDQELLDAAGLKKGVVLTSAEMNDHSKLLMDSGVFDNLTYKFDGVDLIYYLTPAEHLYPMRLENLPLATGNDLEAKLHDRFPLYHGKVPADGTLLQGVIDFLRQALAGEGIQATVTATPSGVPNSRKVTGMSFSIASPQVRVGAIQLQGASADMLVKIKRTIDHQTGTPFDTENTAANLEHAITSFYADEGYAAVKAHAVRSGDPINGADGVDIPYSVTVEEGRIYKLGTIQLPAGALVTQAEIDKAAAPQPASPSKGAAIRFVWFAISQKYKSKGYLDCVVTPRPLLNEAAGQVNYTVEIEPGPIYHLALLKFENVSDDLRKLLMRNWQMMPGDPFDESYVSGFILAAQKADPVLMRSLAGVKATYDVRADPQTHEVNCVLRLEKVH
ncbi:MAG: POTRA domain-containing protein [Terracidiphilus sp.]|jgi:outer membrane protein assembly factor BamA|nr:POTRA domain-containing protein [Terracidiphilus sp.]